MLYITYCIEVFDGVGSTRVISDAKIEQFFRDEAEFIGEDGFDEGEDEESEVARCVREFQEGAMYGNSFSVSINSREHHFEPITKCLAEPYLGEYAYRALEAFVKNLDN